MDRKIMIGIDAGFRHTGLYAVEVTPGTKSGYTYLEWACVHTGNRKKADKKKMYVADMDAEDCKHLAINIRKFIERWMNEGDVVIVVESPHGGAKSSRAARTMGMISAVIASVVTFLKVPDMWIQPRDSKLALCDNAAASKKEMQAAVREMFPECNDWPKTEKENEHVSDAAAALRVAWGSTLYNLLAL